MEKKQPDKKTTNEKPVSLSPIPFEEVVTDMLAVKPPSEGWKKSTKKPKAKD